MVSITRFNRFVMNWRLGDGSKKKHDHEESGTQNVLHLAGSLDRLHERGSTSQLTFQSQSGEHHHSKDS